MARARPAPPPADIQDRLEVVVGLRDTLAVLNSDRPLEEVLDFVVGQANRLLGSRAAALYLLEPDGTTLTARAARDLAEEEAGWRLTAGWGVVGLAVSERRPSAVWDLAAALPPTDDAMNPGVEDRGSHVRVTVLAHPSGTPGRLDRLRQLSHQYPSLLVVPLVAGERSLGVRQR